MKPFYVLVGSLILSTAAFAQQPPPAGAEGGGDNPPPPPQRRDGPGPGGPGGGGERPGPGGPGMGRGPGGPGGPGGGPGMGMRGMGGGMSMGGGMGGDGMNDPRLRQMMMLRGYLDAVDGYAHIARDPSNAGIAAVVSTADLLRGRGADAGIDYFTKLLPEVKDAAVQRAIRVQLVELYKQANKPEQALEQLRTLMTGAAPSATAGDAKPKE